LKFIEDKIESVRPLFEKGGKFEKLYPLFEAKETFLLTPADVTKDAPHVRDALDMKRLMSIVVLAILPCFLIGTYNAGLQALNAQGAPAGALACILTGLRAVLPIIIVSYAVGGLWEVLFALVRRHEINEGFLVTGLLFPLTLPPSIPLWMVAAGVSFGVVLGKEIFGGTGMNVLNPALTARAFVFFAYPAAMSGEKVWRAVDGFSGATALGTAALAGPDAVSAIQSTGITLRDAFLGTLPGSIGEGSAIGCALGALILIATGIGSWRIMLSCLIGALGMAALINALAGPQSAGIMHLPPIWHIFLGGFMFGTVYMATDPVSAAATRAGQWVYGLGIGMLCILIRCVNPAYPEGMMLSILFLNILAPLIDYGALQMHFKTRTAKRFRRASAK
jgi:Na+-transporting NADH:ubiquinone oxidoreductase subunit B